MRSQSQTLPTNDHDMIPVGPGGDPLTYGIDGNPISLHRALNLLEDIDARTLVATSISLPGGQPCVVRSVLTVFDDAASRGPVPAGHVPQIYASIAFSPEPENRLLHVLWTYGSAAEAEAGHPEAVDEFASGRTRVVNP
ncbi:hypothetical protein [Streptomyces sp. NPDC001089]